VLAATATGMCRVCGSANWVGRWRVQVFLMKVKDFFVIFF
jgi:hypothetical protein